MSDLARGPAIAGIDSKAIAARHRSAIAYIPENRIETAACA